MTNLLQKTANYLQLANTQPSLADMEPAAARQLRKAAYKELAIETTDTTFTARDGAQISVRIYTPTAARDVIVYYHGGGWVINDINTSHESCTLLAEATGHIVVSVDYRLAPEYKFPVPVNDAHDAFLWVQRAFPQARISVSGDSAGGNLAIAVSQLVGRAQIASQLLLYPVTDLSYDSASYATYARGYGLDKDVMQWFGAHYIRDEHDAKNPLIAPLRAEKLDNQPPTYLIVAENDVLKDEGIAFVERLHKANVPVQLSIATGVVHSFFTKNDVFADEIHDTIKEIQHFLTHQVYAK
ncbi:MAG: alpha/beta hydrolase [Solibacillus sp.]